MPSVVPVRCLVAGLIAAGVAGSTANAQQIMIDSPVRAVAPNDAGMYTPVNINVDALRELCTDEKTLIRHFPVGRGRTVDIEVEPFEIFTPDATVVTGTEKGDVEMGRPDVVLLRGRVVGDAESSVFLGISPMMAHGTIQAGGETFYLSSGPWTEMRDILVFDAADLPPGKPFPLLPCGSDQLAPIGDVGEPDGPMPRGTFPCRTARIAIDTVWEHARDLFGGDTHATATYDTILMAAVSEIYHRDLNMHIAVPYLRVWGSDIDPYNVGANDVLGQFRNHWNDNMRHVNRTLAHIFTNAGLNGAGGVAWLGVVCHSSYGYGASGYLGGSFPYPLADRHGGNWDLVVTAHEIGHNFGANHTHSLSPPADGCGNGDCSAPAGGTIMSYCHTCSGGISNIVLHFHDRNLSEMHSYMQSVGSCQLIDRAYVTSDYSTTVGGDSVTIDVLSNDNIGSCGTWSIFSFQTESTFNGTVERSVGTGPEGRDQLVYTPAASFSGVDQFTYRGQTPGQSSQIATVSVRVIRPREPVLVSNRAAGVETGYYQLAQPSVLPNFAALTPYRNVVLGAVNIPSTNGVFANSGRSDEVGAVFSGYIEVPESGTYTLSVESDDGSRLYLGSDLIVDNDGLHGMEERGANVVLGAGMHPIRVEFFENGGGAGCIVRWSSDTIARQPIPANRWFHGESCAVDWDDSGSISSQDFFDFLADFFEGSADFNADGSTNSQDFFDFLTGFFAGC